MKVALLPLIFSIVFSSTTVTNQSKDFKGSVSIPKKWVQKIRTHLKQIEAKDWGKVEPGELYHGHLLMQYKDSYPEVYKSVDELFENSAYILYHSDEQVRRWRGTQGDWPTSKKSPRSIVGYWDGRIVPAATLVKEPEKRTMHYEGYGTIHGDDLATDHPKEISFWRERHLNTPAGQICKVYLVVDISIHRSDLNGVNMRLGNRNYAITMDCKGDE